MFSRNIYSKTPEHWKTRMVSSSVSEPFKMSQKSQNHFCVNLLRKARNIVFNLPLNKQTTQQQPMTNLTSDSANDINLQKSSVITIYKI